MKKEIVVRSSVGLHASLAAKIVQVTSKYNVEVLLHYKNKTVDVKSILGLMSLAIPSGENIVIEVNGDNASDAISDISSILSDN